ncbi:hypothetical protein B9G53_06140 [Pseudanabaena sp. SR411]|uniref:AAA family ATPase n=1 Tax=Pseudanabaena sp. SR411 TaxID=1980935 RepID=UPI000B997DF0|nr:ATP-binding protein [Pseudanabaena sp. SR411]OYQ65833.1 hypothetical protein B9G53_06140 [Pseudanabaena sp. SR411]
MHIRSLNIENFRAIRQLELRDLPNAIVVAGPNGCGKSSLFDAIRLLKSAYGQYNPNEYQSFFQEFQINVQRLNQEGHRFFHDPTKPLHIKAEFELTDNEKNYLKKHAHGLVSNLFWGHEQQIFSPIMAVNSLVVDPSTRRAKEPQVTEQVNEFLKAFQPALEEKFHVAKLSMTPRGEPFSMDSPVIELIFKLYQPKFLGVVEYHGANRNYGREQIGGINLQISDSNQQHKQHALYNTENKYRNVKTEMAQFYIRQILAEKAGISFAEQNDLHQTLNELFEVFFPGKKFIGPIPTEEGGLSFPVRLENDREIDIDELSSGEKEVLLGYLRLRSNSPKNSIILLDEPELHLNPRLIRGLPRFYQKHLGKALDNQLFLVTHSDALLREAVEDSEYAVYHMQPAHATDPNSNQAIPVSAGSEIERAVIDLVGDLATYSPRSKIVIVEGDSESEFDVTLIKQLFPAFAERVNLISGGNKTGVKTLQVLLNKAADKGKLDAGFYSIVDKDYDGPELVESIRQYSWDVYHIENYLLEPKFIREVLKKIGSKQEYLSEIEIENNLRECAKETIENILKIQMESWINSLFQKSIDLGFNPKLELIQGFSQATQRSLNKIDTTVKNQLTMEKLTQKNEEIRNELNTAIQNNTWKTEFRGRNILKQFASKIFVGKSKGVNYEIFRNLIINQMRETGYQPPEMKKIIETILSE